MKESPAFDDDAKSKLAAWIWVPDQRRFFGTVGSAPDSDRAKFAASGNAASIAGLSIGSFPLPRLPPTDPALPVLARQVFFVFGRWNPAAWNRINYHQTSAKTRKQDLIAMPKENDLEGAQGSRRQT
jgi:hypothetical protein